MLFFLVYYRKRIYSKLHRFPQRMTDQNLSSSSFPSSLSDKSSDDGSGEYKESPNQENDRVPLLSPAASSTKQRHKDRHQNCELTVYWTRWVMLILFSLNTMMNGVMFMGLSAISNIASRYYGKTVVLIEWLSNMYLIFYVIVALPAAYLMTRWGIRIVLVIASGIQTAASVLHYAGYKSESFMFVLIGQILAGISYGIILQIPGKLSVTWFPKRERATATSIGVFTNVFGVALGFAMPATIVKDSDDKSVVESGIKLLFLAQMIMNCAIFLLTILFLREKPPTPVSNARSEDIELEFFESLRYLVKDKFYMIVSQAYGVYFGLFVTVLVVVSPLVTERFPDGYSSLIGWMGFTFCMVSILACLLIGFWLDYFKGFQTAAVFLTLTSTIVWIAFVLSLHYFLSFAAVFVLFALHGFVGVPYFACGLEQIGEMAYPVPESTSGAFALIIGNFYGCIFVSCGSVLIANGHEFLCGIIIIILYFISFVAACFGKTVLKRTIAEEELLEILRPPSDDPQEKWVNIQVCKSKHQTRRPSRK